MMVKVYLFRLRDGTWPGGARITAETAAAALRKALAQIKGTALGLDLAAIETSAGHGRPG